MIYCVNLEGGKPRNLDKYDRQTDKETERHDMLCKFRRW